MDAKEAKKIADYNQQNKLDKVFVAIRIAAEQGKYYIHIYEPLTRDQVAELIDIHKYVVQNVTQYNETCFYIGWKEGVAIDPPKRTDDGKSS